MTQLAADPPKDGDPLWQQDFPINRAEELNNSRRQFLKFLGLTSLAFFTGTLGVALKALFEERRTSGLPAHRIASAAEARQRRSIDFHYPDESYPAILVHLPGKPAGEEFVAYERRCTHLLCPVLYQQERNRLYCPCHEGVFNPENGHVEAGPPPRPLNKIRVEVRGEDVYAVGRGES
jgi:Rieske Fe-S protein